MDGQRHKNGGGLTALDRLIRYCIDNKLVVGMVAAVLVAWGLLVAPFDWDLRGLPRDPVPVDAIPDIGENQQIVFSEWKGRSPQDIEDQISYFIREYISFFPVYCYHDFLFLSRLLKAYLSKHLKVLCAISFLLCQ